MSFSKHTFIEKKFESKAVLQSSFNEVTQEESPQLAEVPVRQVSLYDQLKLNELKDDEAYWERKKLQVPIRPYDQDDYEHVSEVMDRDITKNLLVKKSEKEQLQEFKRKQQLTTVTQGIQKPKIAKKDFQKSLLKSIVKRKQSDDPKKQ